MPDAQADRAVTFPRRIILFALALLIPAILLCMFPEWDLAASAFFYDAPHGGFYLADQIPLVALHEIATKGAWVLGLILLVLTVATGLRRQPLHGQPMKNWLFLLITLIVGPVLVANMGLKDHWGRARPREIIEFGGMAHFSAALSPEPVLHKNGSFVNGDASFGFFLPNFAYLFRRPDEAQKSRRIFWGGMLLGAVFGATRIVMGAHFLSDTLFAALIIIPISILLHTVMYGYKETRRMWHIWFGFESWLTP